MASSKSFTNNEIRDRIQNIWSKFVLGVEPDRLSDWLVQENVITSDQWQRIHTDHPTRQSRCRALLHYLFSIPHPRAFLVVYQALTEESHYLRESIDNQEPVSGTGSQPAIQNFLQGKTRLQQPENDNEDQKRSWETQKMQKELATNLHVDKKKIEQLEKDNEDKKTAWEAEKERLLKRQKELETKLSLDKKKILQLEKEQEDQKRAWEEEKDRLLEMQKEHEDQKRALEAEKDRLLKIQNEHEDQKTSWEAEKDRLLTMLQELETKLNLDEGDLNPNKRSEQSLLAEESSEIDLLKKKNSELRKEREARKTGQPAPQSPNYYNMPMLKSHNSQYMNWGPPQSQPAAGHIQPPDKLSQRPPCKPRPQYHAYENYPW